MVSQTPAAPPRLSSFPLAAQEWMREDYVAGVVRHALDAREQVSAEMKRALDTAIRNSGVRVPGGFRPQAVPTAPSHHLHMPVLRKMQDSDELVGAILRIWTSSRTDLYEVVVQRLQENDEPTYGPDRKEGCFRDIWDTKDWEANRDQLLAEHDEFDRDDVGLMLWYVSGKIPLPASVAESASYGVDFDQWRELLRVLPADAPQWEQAREFAAVVLELVAAKEKQRVQIAVNILKAKVTSIRQQFSEELTYLERDVELWAAPAAVPPSLAARGLEQATLLESLLSEYRLIRDQAPVRSEEYMRASRRAELETEIIAALGEMERFLSGSLTPDEVEAPAPDTVAEVAEAAGGVEVAEVAEVDGVAEVAEDDAEPVVVIPEAPVAAREPDLAQDAPAAAPAPTGPEVAVVLEENASLLADMQAVRDELENAKAELHSSKESAEYWRSTYMSAHKDPAGDAAAQELSEPQNVVDAVRLAEKKFPVELLFQLNARSWVNKNNPFNDPKSVLEALEWLATTYYRSRTGEISVPKLDESLYEVCRWKYVSNQSDVTMGQYLNHYQTKVDGNFYRLEEHIGRGNSKDPTNTIRIAFHWDRERRRVIVGYIGQHQQTDAT